MQGIAIRYAHRDEASEIAELVNSSQVLGAGSLTSPRDITSMFESGSFLVLERPSGGLAAAVYVSMSHHVAEVDMLSVARDIGSDIDPDGLKRRLVSVAEMVCNAHGCHAVERRFASEVERGLATWGIES